MWSSIELVRTRKVVRRLIASPRRGGGVFGVVTGALLPSLRARFALASITIACVPLILAVIITADQIEGVLISQALIEQEVRATAQSLDVRDYVQLHLAAVATVASRLDLATLTADQQRAALHSLVATDVFAFSTYNASGQPVARGDDLPLAPLAPPLIDLVRRTNAPAQAIVISPQLHRPVLTLAAPVLGRAGTLNGYVAAEIDPRQLVTELNRFDPEGRTQSTVFLVDQAGHVIAHPDPAVLTSRADLSRLPPVQAARAARSAGGDRYSTSQGDQLAGYAPVPDLGWSVIVERPVAVVLAGTEVARDLIFVILVLVLLASALAGVFFADRLVKPLRALERAVARLAEGDPTAALPTSEIREVARLAAHFGQMRDRLAVRTREREDALCHAQAARAEAEVAVRQRDEFLSIAAHELKTPITSLRLSVQGLLFERQRQMEIDPRRLERAFQTVDEQSIKLTRMVVQLLEVSRLQQGRLTLDQGRVDLAGLVRGVVQDARSRAGNHQLVLTTPSEAWVWVDPLRLEQVLTNLLDNAIKYSPDGGPIEIALRVAPAGGIALSVRDHGIGIPAEHYPRIFDLFYQAHAESHRSGMGVGLFITRQIVELHGGQVTAETLGDGGTIFRVSLPAQLLAVAAERDLDGDTSVRPAWEAR